MRHGARLRNRGIWRIIFFFSFLFLGRRFFPIMSLKAFFLIYLFLFSYASNVYQKRGGGGLARLHVLFTGTTGSGMVLSTGQSARWQRRLIPSQWVPTYFRNRHIHGREREKESSVWRHRPPARGRIMARIGAWWSRLGMYGKSENGLTLCIQACRRQKESMASPRRLGTSVSARGVTPVFILSSSSG